MITDLINLFLIDRNLDNYVNKFTVRMQAPVTQEELDRRTNTDNRIRYVGDLMQQLSDIEDKATKLKIYKALLGSAINDPEVIGYIQAYIDTLEKSKDPDASGDDTADESLKFDSGDELPALEAFEPNTSLEVIVEDDSEEESYLPSPDELELDLTNPDNK